jgi:ferredoxin
MATIITEECINCGACEPECPNTAIYQGGVEFDLNGQKKPALSEEIFFIVPEKCTECVGFFDYEACAAVCPVDCCVTDPDRPESEEVLLARAKELHPDTDFGDKPPSRFSPSEAAPAAEAGGAGGAAASAAAQAAPAAPAAQAAPIAAGASVLSASGRVEKPVVRATRAPRGGAVKLSRSNELDTPFEEVMSHVKRRDTNAGSRLVGLVLLVLTPVLGALPDKTKRAIEDAYGDTRFFSSQLATAVNIVQDFILYPVLAFAAGLLTGRFAAFTEADRGPIMVGVLIALVETVVRLREGIFHFIPAARMRYGASFYGAPLGVFLNPIVRRFLHARQSGWVPVEGFYDRVFEPKREREKRYGEVYNVAEFDHGYYIRMELPREIPPSAAKEELGFGDEMPDYDMRIAVDGNTVTISGSVADIELRKICGVSPAFPADFKTEIELPGRAGSFKYRYEDKLLELAVLKEAA